MVGMVRWIVPGVLAVALVVVIVAVTRGSDPPAPRARERDIAKRYVRDSRVRATGGDFQKGLEWRTVKLIKDKFKIPLVIKGIATAEDAEIALDHGVDWIYVSNHGGRQLDHGRGAMHVLPEISRPLRAAPRSWSMVRSAAVPTS